MVRMDIRQVSVIYREEQDRILVRINTAQSEELRLWLTRRLVRSLSPALERAIEQAGDFAAAAEGRPTPPDAMARRAISAFEREAALRQANFAVPYAVKTEASLPLGSEPLLISEVRIAPQSSGALQIAFEEKPPEGAPRGFQLELKGTLMHAFCHLLEQAIVTAQWRAAMPSAPAEPDAGPGAPEAPRRYLN